MSMHSPAAAVAVLALAACGSSGSSTPDGGRPDSGFASLEECVVGTWLSEIPTCPCPSPTSTPECPLADCAWANVFVLREGGTAFHFVTTRSETTRTFSVYFACPVSMSWIVIDNERLAVGGDPSSSPGEIVTCDAEHLSYGPRPDRAMGPFGDALAVIPDASNCTGIAY